MKKIAHFSLLVVLLFGLTACTRNRLRELDVTATVGAPAAATAATSLIETETPVNLPDNTLEAATAETIPTLAPTSSPLPAQPSQAEGLSQDLEETLNQLEQLLDGMDTNVTVP